MASFKLNPKHKGWCTPLSNPKCTGKRRAFALAAKKTHGFRTHGKRQWPSTHKYH